MLTTRQQRDRSAVKALADVLGRVGSYQLVMIDCPPSSGVLLDAALMAARFLVIPTRGDSGSLDGLVKVARRFADVRTGGNPLLELLGVVLFDFGHKDTAVRARLTTDLAGAAPVFEAFIRNSRMAPGDMRDLGLLAYEYEWAATQAPRCWRTGPPRATHLPWFLAMVITSRPELVIVSSNCRGELGAVHLQHTDEKVRLIVGEPRHCRHPAELVAQDVIKRPAEFRTTTAFWPMYFIRPSDCLRNCRSSVPQE